jgi:putative photosynthetic complex assembly protein
MHTPALQRHAGERGLLMVALAAIALAIGWAAWSRHSGQPLHEADAPLAAERLLRFEDRPDGSLRVSDARSGALVQVITGEAGFARGTLRSFMRERRRTGAGPELPLALRAYGDGRLSLSDPATGQRVELDSFGPANASVFAQMLHPPGEPK